MKLFTTTALLAACVAYSAHACTGISLSTTDNQFVQARTIEWANSDLESKLVIVPRNASYTSTMPNMEKGLTWTSKYGFAGISVVVDKFIADGINEEGLTAGMFYFSHYGSLAKFDPNSVSNNIVDMDFVRWILSQFKTVDEVVTALETIKIVPVHIDGQGNPTPTAHWRVTDKEGNNVVIEIMDEGKINIHKNIAKVLTNSPDYPWHIKNLNNYLTQHPGTSPNAKINDVDAFSFGVGSASFGLPGDISPTSRFVRASFYVNTAPTLTTSEKTVAQAFHILNNFDLPVGSEFAQKSQIPDLPSATQWTIAVDQSNKTLYYKTMYDSRIRKVELSELNFDADKEIIRPLDETKQFEPLNITQQFVEKNN